MFAFLLPLQFTYLSQPDTVLLEKRKIGLDFFCLSPHSNQTRHGDTNANANSEPPFGVEGKGAGSMFAPA